MRQRYRHECLVIGNGAFPMDMLRYDCCHPKGPEDVNAMVYSLRSRDDGGIGSRQYRVTLVRESDHKEISKAWTTARWNSFGAGLFEFTATKLV